MNTAQWIRMAPLLLMLAITSLIATGVFNDNEHKGKHIGKKVGTFLIPRLDEPGIKMNRTAWKGQIAIINLFSAHCKSCEEERGVLMELAQTGIAPIYGIAFRSKREDAIRFLQQYGNPYQMIGQDKYGTTNVPFSMKGVPETLVVGTDGLVYYHYTDRLTKEQVDKVILPLIERLRAK